MGKEYAVEYIIGLIIIIVLLLLVGVSWETVTAGIILLLSAVVVIMLLMFAWSVIMLVFSKRREAEFLRTEKSPKGRFRVAYYKCGGEEYSCIFPAEPFFEKKFYPSDRKHSVWLIGKRKILFDRYAAVTCVTGFVFSLLLVVSMIYILLFY